MKNISKLGLISFFVSLSTSSIAANYTISVSSSLEHTDNVRKDDRNKRNDTHSTIGVDVSYLEESARIKTSNTFRLYRTDYFRNTFSDETELVGDSRIDFSILPERLDWFVSYQRSRTLSQNTDADTPDNRVTRKVFQTGPSYILRLSGQDTLNTSLLYADNSFDDSDSVGSDSKTANLSWNHLYSDKLTGNLNTTYTDVGSDETGSDYERSSLSYGFNGIMQNGTYSIEYGRNKIKREQLSSVTGNFYQANINYSGSRYKFGFVADRELTDTSIGLSLNDLFGVDFLSNDTSFEINEVVERTRYEAYYNQRVMDDRLSTTFRIFNDKEDFDGRLNDTDNRGASFDVTYELPGNWSNQTSTSYEVETPKDSSLRKSYYRSLRTEMKYQFSEKLNINTWLTFSRRDWEGGGADEYQEWVVGASVGYAF